MPPTATTIPEGDFPRSINGVATLNKRGILKSRYHWEEKLQMLACTEQQLHGYADLLAPRKTHYSLRRASHRDTGRWFEGRGELPLDLIAWQLLGARVPKRYPLWIAPRAWDWTRFVAIDVDLRDDEADFQRRCRHVEDAFRLLDVSPESWLVVPTPSGGRHFYFFTTEKIRTADIAPVMAKVGIAACKGKFEIFPSTSQGLRLPFGHIPGRPHCADEWVRFIDNYQHGQLPKVDWAACQHMANSHWADRKRQQTLFPLSPQSPTPPEPKKPCVPGERKPRVPLSKAKPALPTQGLCNADRQKVRRYEALLNQPVRSPADIEQMLDLGICTQGTRHEAVMRLAWNFIFVRGCNEEDSVREIAGWTYRTGAGISKDVEADLNGGGDMVLYDIKDLVHRFSVLRDEQGQGGACLFSESEMDAIRKATLDSEQELRFPRARFLLEFLHFAKTKGWPTVDGWECRPAAEGIMRRWRGCSGTRYKAHLDWALAAGIVGLTKEKCQTNDRTGRPRTFVLRVPLTMRTNWNLTREDSLARLKQWTLDATNFVKSTPGPDAKSDRYHVGFPTKEEMDGKILQASDPKMKPVPEVNEEVTGQTTTIPTPGQGLNGHAPTARNETHADRSLDPAPAAGDGGPNPSGAPTSGAPTPGDHIPGAPIPGYPANTPTGDEGGEHSGRAICHLAAGTPECPAVGPTLQGICHPSARPIGTLFHRHNHQRYHRHNRRFGTILSLYPAELGVIDPTRVRQILAEVKQSLIHAHPDRRAYVADHPTWPLIEAMVLDPTYSLKQRYVLLANPLHLSQCELDFRKQLIREYRDHPPIVPTATNSLSPPNPVQPGLSPPIPPEGNGFSG